MEIYAILTLSTMRTDRLWYWGHNKLHSHRIYLRVTHDNLHDDVLQGGIYVSFYVHRPVRITIGEEIELINTKFQRINLNSISIQALVLHMENPEWSHYYAHECPNILTSERNRLSPDALLAKTLGTCRNTHTWQQIPIHEYESDLGYRTSTRA